MKLMKKFSKAILVVVLCMLLVTTAWATEQAIATYSATLDVSEICVNDLAKEVTLTAKVNELVAMDAFTAQVTVPEGWNIKAISNEKLQTNFNSNLENGMILWYADAAEDVNNDLLATVTIEVPADAGAGEYEIQFEIIDISRAWGVPWENGKVLTATVNICDHADGDDADHLCDYCQGAVEGKDCVYVPGEYTWSDDYSTCSVVGTCACGETVTANAAVTSNTIAGTCKTAGSTTYTADFAEDWAETQTKTVTGEKDSANHEGEQTTAYVANGEKHIVKITCSGCGTVISETEADHVYTDGKCECGAEEPGDPIVPAGMLGDLDLDGDVDAYDLTILARHVGGIELLTDSVALNNADVNIDGKIDANDLTKHARFVGGIIADWKDN